MTIADLLAAAGSPRLDAEVLLAHALGKDRPWLIAHDRDEVETRSAATFEDFMHRRNAGEPLAYITGQREFYGRMFGVRADVLIPRPCTEALVTAALDMLAGKRVEAVRMIDAGIVCAVQAIGDCAGVRTVVDVGTGSGCIAISLACEREDLRCIAIDASGKALDVARENIERLGMGKRVQCMEGKALEPVKNLSEPFIVVTNPPYVTDVALLASDVLMHEPRMALIGGGKDGGDILRAIVAQAHANPSCRGIIAECLESQATILIPRARPPT